MGSRVGPIHVRLDVPLARLACSACPQRGSNTGVAPSAGAMVAELVAGVPQMQATFLHRCMSCSSIHKQENAKIVHESTETLLRNRSHTPKLKETVCRCDMGPLTSDSGFAHTAVASAHNLRAQPGGILEGESKTRTGRRGIKPAGAHRICHKTCTQSAQESHVLNGMAPAIDI